MNTADFEGIFKFKLIIPTLYVCSWVAVFLGPSLFPVVYQCYCIVLWLLFLTRMGYMLFNLLIVLARTYNTLKGYQSPSITNTGSESVQNHRLLPVSCDRYYAFVIPSYKEDVDLLADTLSWIASHSRSRSNYLVFMAMERHEEGSEQKASAIISRFRHCFRLMEYTCHELR
jgi:cellulose synthase/poly-beta-1,6-N-acetylglucosamine synthase-like glycosyltransferase